MSSRSIPTCIAGPEELSHTGAGDIPFTIDVALARRWRLVIENASTSTGNITGVSWRRSAIDEHYGPADAQTVSEPVAPGDSWGASDDGDCVAKLEVTVTVDDDATITYSFVGV